MTDVITANTIQAAVRVERSRIVGIILREATWLRETMKKLSRDEQNRCGREIQVLLDLVEEIEKS